MIRTILRFMRRDDGVVAVIFAVMAIPFIAMAGWAVDYLRLQHVEEKLQIEADSAALNALLQDAQWGDVQAAAMAELTHNYNGSWADEIEVTGRWLNAVDFEVTAEANVPLAFIKLLPGIGETQQVVVSAIARLNEPTLDYEPPSFTSLSFEAADFNRLWLYCFWPNRPLNNRALPRRTQMVPIADNGGSNFVADPGDPDDPHNPIQDANLRSQYHTRTISGTEQLDTKEQGIWRRANDVNGKRLYKYLMPNCPAGSFMSIRLENVRDSRTASHRWDANANGTGPGNRYNYYTDTEIETGQADTYHGLTDPKDPRRKVTILETIVCDTLTACMTPPSEGGLIPPRRVGRDPAVADQGCSPNKYVYYGWEDRPPELAGSDRDYDDIRIVMACPQLKSTGERAVRLLS